MAPPGGWDLTTIADWISNDVMTDEYPISGETTEARHAFQLLWPYCSNVFGDNVDGQDSCDDWELLIDYPSDDNGEQDGGDMEGIEAAEKDTMGHIHGPTNSSPYKPSIW